MPPATKCSTRQLRASNPTPLSEFSPKMNWSNTSPYPDEAREHFPIHVASDRFLTYVAIDPLLHSHII